MHSAAIAQLVDRLLATKPLSLGAARARTACTIESIDPQGPKYLSLKLIAPAPLAATHTVPAQYTTLQLGELAPRFFVIASPPARP